MYAEGVSSLLRRDRVDKKFEEATFVSTDSTRMTGSVKFEVCDRNNLLLSGVLEMPNSKDFTGEIKNHNKRWTMNCQSNVSFSRGKQHMGSESLLPTVEVFVVGCFSGTLIIFSKTLCLTFRNEHARSMLDSIPEYETTETKMNILSDHALQLSNLEDYKLENDEDEYNNSVYSRAEYMDREDGELSWFNAGVRVGVGIGLGICVGVGVGVGLLIRIYQATTRNCKRK